MILPPASASRRIIVLLLFAASACSTSSSSSSAEGAPTNATVTFVVHGANGALEREGKTCLVVTKPGSKSLRNGADAGDAVDGRLRFPAGTRATAIVARYGMLLTQSGWRAGTDFVAVDNALHFYGVTEIGGGSGEAVIGVHGATDSERVPYRVVALATR